MKHKILILLTLLLSCACNAIPNFKVVNNSSVDYVFTTVENKNSAAFNHTVAANTQIIQDIALGDSLRIAVLQNNVMIGNIVLSTEFGSENSIQGTDCYIDVPAHSTEGTYVNYEFQPYKFQQDNYKLSCDDHSPVTLTFTINSSSFN